MFSFNQDYFFIRFHKNLKRGKKIILSIIFKFNSWINKVSLIILDILNLLYQETLFFYIWKFRLFYLILRFNLN